MFALKLDDTLLEVAPDATIRVVLSCPLFDRDRIVRTFSYPFALPLTPANLRGLDYVNRFDAARPWDTEGCSLRLGGGEFERGELLSTGSTDEAIEAMFRNVPVTLADTLARLNINELLETIEIPATGPDAIVALTITAPPFAYDITIGGINYTLGIGGSSGMSTSDVGVYFRDLINADYPGMATSDTTSLYLDSAMINDHTADWSVMTGFTIASYVTVGQSAQQSFLNYVEGVKASPEDSHAWPTIYWRGLYQGKNSLYEDYVNPLFDSGLENEENEDETAFHYTYMPLVRVPYILEKIREAAGIGYLAGYVDDADFAALLVLNNLTCDLSYLDWYADEQFKYINGYTQEINLNKHVPKMTALDFLKRLADGLNLIIEYKQGGLWLTKALDLVTPAPADWSQYVEARKYNRAITKPEGLTLEHPENEKDGFSVVGQLADYVVGEGKVRRVQPFGTMYMSNGFLLGHGVFRCPTTDQPGQSPILGGNASDLPFGLVFYRGVKETSETEEYVYATHDELDNDGSTVIGGLSLAFEGDYGLVAQNFGATLGYGDKSEIDFTAILPIGEVYRLRQWENARVRFYHPNGVVTAVVRSVDLALDAQGDGGWVQAKVAALME